jgi:hypothetical protein
MGCLRGIFSGSVHCRKQCLCRASPKDARALHDAEFAQLLTAFPVDGYVSRARSASDAGVLRRKGRLKEQDQVATRCCRPNFDFSETNAVTTNILTSASC